MKLDSGFFDTPISRVGTDCEKWDGMHRQHGDPEMLPMWVADMDFAAPPAVTEALRERAAHPIYGYTCVGRKDNDALRGFWQRRHGLSIEADWPVMLPCVITGLRLCVQALTQPGDGVIVQTPVYGPFLGAAALDGRRRLENPLLEREGRYTIDFDGLEAQMRNGGRLLMLCNPHNPVGRAFSQEELSRMLELARRYEVVILVDEIHADFVFAPGRHVPMLSLPGAGERVVMLCSASKTFNLAGLQQASVIVPNPALRDLLVQKKEAFGVVCGNLMALVATRAAYDQGEAWLSDLMDYLTQSRQIASDFLAAELPQIRVSPLEATYLMWLDFRALGLSQEELLSLCLEKGRVKLSEGSFFGEEGRGFLRLNIACPHAQLHQALERLKKAVAGR